MPSGDIALEKWLTQWALYRTAVLTGSSDVRTPEEGMLDTEQNFTAFARGPWGKSRSDLKCPWCRFTSNDASSDAGAREAANTLESFLYDFWAGACDDEAMRAYTAAVAAELEPKPEPDLELSGASFVGPSGKTLFDDAEFSELRRKPKPTVKKPFPLAYACSQWVVRRHMIPAFGGLAGWHKGAIFRLLSRKNFLSDRRWEARVTCYIMERIYLPSKDALDVKVITSDVGWLYEKYLRSDGFMTASDRFPP